VDPGRGARLLQKNGTHHTQFVHLFVNLLLHSGPNNMAGIEQAVKDTEVNNI
jgi:hypothetical protein